MKSEKELLEVVQRWDEAIANNELSEMEKYMSPDWVIISTGGGITSMTDFLAAIRSGEVVHSKMTTDESRIKIYDNAGVITAKGVSEGTYKGQFFSLHEWSTSVFIWEDNQWICVLTMLTPIMTG